MTDRKMLAVAVLFAASMGWIDSPGGAEWYGSVKNWGGPDAFLAQLCSALAMATAADPAEACCGIQDLKALERTWDKILK